jgi:ComF family protein
MRLDSATPFCKICFKDKTGFGWSDFESDHPLCNECFASMEPHEEVFKVGPYYARCLYSYTERIRSLLYQLKGCKDIELAGIFLAKQAPILKLIYNGYEMVPAPSFRRRDLDRGFNHVHEMFKCLKLPFINALEKTDDIKQADSSFEERLNVSKHIRFRDDASVLNRKILFVDDLITTGSTAKACCDLLMDRGAKTVRILAMGHTRKKETEKAKRKGFGALATFFKSP